MSIYCNYSLLRCFKSWKNNQTNKKFLLYPFYCNVVLYELDFFGLRHAIVALFISQYTLFVNSIFNLKELRTCALELAELF